MTLYRGEQWLEQLWISHQKPRRAGKGETTTLRSELSTSNSTSSENFLQEWKQNKDIFFFLRWRKAKRIHQEQNCFLRNTKEIFQLKGSSGLTAKQQKWQVSGWIEKTIFFFLLRFLKYVWLKKAKTCKIFSIWRCNMKDHYNMNFGGRTYMVWRLLPVIWSGTKLAPIRLRKYG